MVLNYYSGKLMAVAFQTITYGLSYTCIFEYTCVYTYAATHIATTHAAQPYIVAKQMAADALFNCGLALSQQCVCAWPHQKFL